MNDKTKAERVTRVTAPSTIDIGGVPEALPQFGRPVVPGDLGSFGRYRISRLLGSGGMGGVYEAVDPALGRTVALKVLLPGLNASTTARRRFLREARSVAAIKHDHIVTIFEVGEHDSTPYLAMEYLSGCNLADHCRTCPVPLVDAVRIGREIATGLAAAHEAGIIHRDIKLENIWLEKKGERRAMLDGRDPGSRPSSDPGSFSVPAFRVKILDFGLARKDDETEPITRLGAVLGTVGFMAPEQIEGRPIDAKSDLFGLGVVLYRLVTGRFPYYGSTAKEVVAAFAAGPPPPVESLNSAATPALAGLIHQLLAIDPASRPTAAGDVAEALGAVEIRLHGGDPGPIKEALPVWEGLEGWGGDATPGPGSRWGRWKLWGAAVIAAGLVVGAGALILGLRPQPTTEVVARQAPPPPPEAKAAPPEAVAPPPLALPPEAPAPAPKPEVIAPRFVPLFNGKDLTGWSPLGDRSDAWSIADGVLAGTPKGPDQMLFTERQYTDFDLRLEYRWPTQGGHTVIMLRTVDTGKQEPEALFVNIGDDEHFPEVHGRPIGRLYQTGGIQWIKSCPNAGNKPIGEWNSLRVVMERQHVRVIHNGRETVDVDLDDHVSKAAQVPAIARSKGAIALRVHWGPIEFRNILLGPPGE